MDKIGTRVRMVNCLQAESHPDKIWTTRSEPWELCGVRVVLLEGKSGGFDVNCLEEVTECKED